MPEKYCGQINGVARKQLLEIVAAVHRFAERRIFGVCEPSGHSCDGSKPSDASHTVRGGGPSVFGR